MTEPRGTTAVDKAFDLLRIIQAHEETAFGVSEIARTAGLPKSTAFRLLNALERNQAVKREGRYYRLGRMFAPELRMPSSEEAQRVQMALTPALAALFERTRETVQLCMLIDGAVVFLNKLHSHHRVPSPSRIGGHAPAYCTSVGKALLAFDPKATDLVCSRGLERWTPHTICDPDELRTELARVRRTKIGTDDEEYVPGVASVAAPVFSADGRAVASLCVTWPRREGMKPEYERLVLEVATRARRRYVRYAA